MFRAAFSVALALAATVSTAQPAPTELRGLSYDADFFPGSTYDESVPTVEEILGFRAGDRAAFPAEIERALRVWDEVSPRTRLVEYARSHEGRALYYMIISSPENMARLDEIKAGLGRLADPRGLGDAEAQSLLDSLPVPAWLAYSIHGDETSGTDGAMAIVYHLTASLDEAIVDLLDDVVVLIDPMMNPDGRHRFLQQIAEHRGSAPNVDDQSLLHSGYWPWGRGNHYHFDLNRDWILGVNPETRGRIRAAADWHPLLFVDAHEMGAQDTYLFAPAREPRNPHFPSRRSHWSSIFARQQSEAFDRYNWLYYTGEWNEGWYPGYSDSWGEFRGAVGILYEQAGIAEDAVRRPEGTLLTYREATHHQAVSSLANLETLHRNADALLAEFLAEKRRAVSPDGPYANRTFAILPTRNHTRLEGFLDQMELQGFEVYAIDEPLVARSGTDQLGRRFRDRTLPAGTLLIPNRQPEAHLLATMLEFDRPMPEEYLARERKSILRGDGSTIYDVTAWNLTMMHGLDALTLDSALPTGATRYSSPETPRPAVAEAIVGWVIDGIDDASLTAAARLMERDVRVRVARRPFELGGTRFSRGSLLVLPADNAAGSIDLATTLADTAGGLGLVVSPISTGLGEGDLPDIGGDHFALLERPSLALVGRGAFSTTDYGAIWHALDQRLGIRYSRLDVDALASLDLRRYNVLVLPHLWGELPDSVVERLTPWVESGGTLIAIGRSAVELADESSKLTSVRTLPEVLDQLDEYETVVLREWMAASSQLPEAESIWSYSLPPEIRFPWSDLEASEREPKAELERRDRWQSLFMPQGAFVAARADREHWLTFGLDDSLPVLYLGGYLGASDVLMAGTGVDSPIRLGVLEPEAGTPTRRLGWGAVPAGHELRLRMSGLLWPEAAQRIANAPWVTRERKGNGQVILFATPPIFRGATMETTRVLFNAIVYGPGFGARHPIRP